MTEHGSYAGYAGFSSAFLQGGRRGSLHEDLTKNGITVSIRNFCGICGLRWEAGLRILRGGPQRD